MVRSEIASALAASLALSRRRGDGIARPESIMDRHLRPSAPGVDRVQLMADLGDCIAPVEPERSGPCCGLYVATSVQDMKYAVNWLIDQFGDFPRREQLWFDHSRSSKQVPLEERACSREHVVNGLGGVKNGVSKCERS